MNYLRLETNRPTVIALKYPTGKECTGFDGKQLRWILMDGQALYTPLDMGKQIADLKIRAGEKFTITKLSKGEWKASRLTPVSQILDNAEALDEPQLTGVPQRQRPNGALVEGVNSTVRPAAPTTQLATALKTAVAAAAEAEAHGAAIGYVVRFAPSDIRAMGISVLISMQGNRHAA